MEQDRESRLTSQHWTAPNEVEVTVPTVAGGELDSKESGFPPDYKITILALFFTR